MKIVINTIYGGFGLSREAIILYAELKGVKLYEGEKESFIQSFYTIPFEQFKEMYEEAKITRVYDKVNSFYWYPDYERNDPLLIKVVEELGVEAASGKYAQLKVVEIPDDIMWEIDEYDGMETIRESSRHWN